MQRELKMIEPSAKLLTQIDRYIRPRTKDITVFDGSIAYLHPSNIRMINPIKIFAKKGKYTYVILHYGSCSKDENDIYLYTKYNKISWLKLIEILQSA